MRVKIDSSLIMKYEILSNSHFSILAEPPAVKSLETKDLGHHDGLVNILLDPAKMKTVDVIQGIKIIIEL